MEIHLPRWVVLLEDTTHVHDKSKWMWWQLKLPVLLSFSRMKLEWTTQRQLLSSFFIPFSEIVSEITFYTARCSPHVNTGWNHRRQAGAYPARGAREDGTLYSSHIILYVEAINQGFILQKVKFLFYSCKVLFQGLFFLKSNHISLPFDEYVPSFNTSVLLCSFFALLEVTSPVLSSCVRLVNTSIVFVCSKWKYSFLSSHNPVVFLGFYVLLFQNSKLVCLYRLLFVMLFYIISFRKFFLSFFVPVSSCFALPKSNFVTLSSLFCYVVPPSCLYLLSQYKMSFYSVFLLSP